MAGKQKVRIAINVMRARLTVVGFNIAIVSFQLSELMNIDGGVFIAGIGHTVHFRADIALIIALGFSILALIAFLSSSALDEVGVCDHWSFIVGDLFMYLGLANAVTGFFFPLHETLTLASEQASLQADELNAFSDMVIILGAILWITTIYIGPLVTLYRSPFETKMNLILLVMYLKALILVFWISHMSLRFELSNSQRHDLSAHHFLYEILQPLLW